MKKTVLTELVGVIAVMLITAAIAGSAFAGEVLDVPPDPRPIVHVHDTSVQPFLRPHGGAWCADPFPTYWEGVWHLYTLQRGYKAVLHFTSTDLVKWTEHEPAMVGNKICTGTVLHHDKKFYMFYTDAVQPRTIRLVVSDNPWQFDFAKSRLVASAGHKAYSESATIRGTAKHHVIDSYVFYYEKEKLWWMLTEGRFPEVYVSLFKSKDLLEWTQHDPIFNSKDNSRVVSSCPQVIREGGCWYLTLLSHGTWYYSADSPYGPWTFRGRYHSVQLTAASRSVTDGNRRLCWGFFGPLGVGRQMVWV